MPSFTAFVSFPSADLTESLIRSALSKLQGISQIIDSLPLPPPLPLLQWSSYDEIDHALCMDSVSSVLSSSYVIRKSIIRKHFLHRSLQQFIAKHPGTSLKLAVPLTWDIDISYADELDEMWSDELYELGCRLPEESPPSGETTQWWILKPGMADRGMGIRLFDSKSSLVAIFEEFEGDESDIEHEDNEQQDHGVMTSHLRHFVIQVSSSHHFICESLRYLKEYLANPVLLDPRQVPLEPNGIAPSKEELRGHKFHLRVYCVAQGGLRLYMCRRILALFSSKSYAAPCRSDGDQTGMVDLTAHLTNTSLQEHRGEEGVRLLSELVGCSVLDGDRFTESDLEDITEQAGDVLADTFRAALDTTVHFQVCWFFRCH